jgi:pimeloyl-ACP methyl ester carboxylesterase
MLSLSHWGSTPPRIVCIHGFADGGYVWSPFAPQLTHYAGVLALDLRGHGDSAWDPVGVYNTNKFVADAQTIVNECCADDILLVGHSLGGEVAIRLASGNRRRVRALVLVDSSPGSSAEGVSLVRHGFSSKAGVYTSKAAYRQALGDSMPLADGEMLELCVRHTLTGSDEVCRLKCDPRLADMELSGRREELWPLLESLHLPCLLIRGEASAVVPRQLSVAMMRRVRNLRCATVALAGHAVMMDNPQEFGSILRSFVASVYAGSRPADSMARTSETGRCMPPC